MLIQIDSLALDKMKWTLSKYSWLLTSSTLLSSADIRQGTHTIRTSNIVYITLFIDPYFSLFSRANQYNKVLRLLRLEITSSLREQIISKQPLLFITFASSGQRLFLKTVTNSFPIISSLALVFHFGNRNLNS